MLALVTAGPTHEPIDTVRYLGNRSSGRMGIAIAESLAARGHRVELLLGPVATPPDDRSLRAMTIRPFRTTADLAALLHDRWPKADLLVMAAAVADFRPAGGACPGKLERGARLLLELEPTPDLLAACAATRRPGQTLVGFALEESARLGERALAKLRRKGIDAIVANPLETMDAPTIDGTLLLSDGSTLRHPDAVAGCGVAKPLFAVWLAERLEALVDARGASAGTT
jgi:phosphopantothenoylcysteine decarboxylase/phosphopantothenate--cysteine ligase